MSSLRAAASSRISTVATVAPDTEPAGKTAFHALKPLTQQVSVDGLAFRKGPVAFSAAAMANALGFEGGPRAESVDYTFAHATKGDLKSFVDEQSDDAGTRAAQKIVAILSKRGVKVATMVKADRTASGSPAVLAARFPDGSVIALRGVVGGHSQ